MAALPEDMKGKEMAYYNALEDNQKAGYMEYRVEQIRIKPAVQKFRLPKYYNKLSDDERQVYIDRAAQNGEAEDEELGEADGGGSTEAEDGGLAEQEQDHGDGYSYVPSDDEELRAVENLAQDNALEWKFAKTLYDTHVQRGKTNRTTVCLYVHVDEASVANDVSPASHSAQFS